MTGKTTTAIIAAVILSVGIPSAPVGNRNASHQSQQHFREASMPPEKGKVYSYLINLENDLIYLTELDSSGATLTRKTIDYINIYSLYPAQLEQLRSGASFDSREAVAEFIQDLGS